MFDGKTIEQAFDEIEKNAANIYVREKVDGKIGRYSLAELPGDLAIKHAFRFIRENRQPVRVKD